MRLNQVEMLVIGALILYMAFYTHPPPTFVTTLLGNPVGQAIAHIAVVLVGFYSNLLVAIVLAIAIAMSHQTPLEYMTNPPEKKQPSAKGVPAPNVTDILQKLMKGQRMPQAQGKDVTAKPKEAVPPKPAVGKEHFASF